MQLARVLPLLAGALAAAPAAAQRHFDLPLHVTESAGGNLRAHGDFDGDGSVDLVHLTGSLLGATGVRILLGDGTGRFTAGPTTPVTASGGTIGFVGPLVGDFDGDGSLDVAIEHDAFGAGSGLEVFFGDGAGGFASTFFLALDDGPEHQAVGEIDGDAEAEIALVVNGAGGNLRIVWADWNGASFTLSTALVVETQGVADLAAGDFDGDGDTDLVGTSADFTEIRAYRTVNGAAKNGPIWTVPAEMQAFNHALLAGDVDGDGDDDFVHLRSNTLFEPGPRIQPYENVGTSVVQHPFEELVDTGFVANFFMTIADWDGDGWLDLLSANHDVRVLRSDGDWTWSNGMLLQNTGQDGGGGPADYDGDGSLDYAGLATINLGDGTFTAPASPAESFTTIASMSDGPRQEDAEGDGDLDLTGGTTGRRYEGRGDAVFVQVLPAWPDPGVDRFWKSQVAFADLDGDGRRDYVVSRYQNLGGSATAFVDMRLVRDDGLGGFEDAGLATPLGFEIVPPVGYWDAADADSDGDLDLLVEGGYWANDGDGFLAAFVPAWTGRARDGADVDDDGDVDLALTRPGAGGNLDVVLLEADGGGFVEHALGQTTTGFELAFVDLDADGDRDLAAGGSGLAVLDTWENAGGTLVDGPSLLGAAHDVRALGIEDADGDGLVDLWLRRTFGGLFLTDGEILTLHRRTGPGLAYELAYEYVLLDQDDPLGHWMDVDADGDLDAFSVSALAGSALLVRQQRVVPPEGSVIQQYGDAHAVAGTGGATPVIGASGPAVSTSSDDELRIVRAVGGGLAIVGFSTVEVVLLDSPIPGMTLLVQAPVLLPLLPLSGTPGSPGEGEGAFVLPNISALLGLTFVHQAFVVDPGSPTGFSSTGGVRITYGV